jgi:hypothetical protein
MTGITPEHVHEMQQEVVVWLTMVSDPRSVSNIEDVNEQAPTHSRVEPPARLHDGGGVRRQ